MGERLTGLAGRDREYRGRVMTGLRVSHESKQHKSPHDIPRQFRDRSLPLERLEQALRHILTGKVRLLVWHRVMEKLASKAIDNLEEIVFMLCSKLSIPSALLYTPFQVNAWSRAKSALNALSEALSLLGATQTLNVSFSHTQLPIHSS